MEVAEVQVPSYYLCPISLQIMKDPVTLPTGITYDRESIEQWMYSGGNHHTCPVSKQTLPDSCDLTPNHTLRRLIQAWCAANASRGVERFPTPRHPVDKASIAALLEEARQPTSRLPVLNKLKKIVSESERNKRCVEAAHGSVDFLVSIISNLPSVEEDESVAASVDEAVGILYSLQISEQSLLALFRRNQDLFESLTTVMQRTPDYQTRAYAVLLIKSLLGVATASRLMSMGNEFFEEIVKVLRDRISYQAMKAGLQVLYSACPWGKNMKKAVRAGAVSVLVELLMDEPEKRTSEMMMVVLDELCGCAEGRAELVGHAAGLAVVSKKMVRVSAVATDTAVRLLYSISLHPATPAVLEEMMQVGVVSKLCSLLHVKLCGKSTREMAKEILRMHCRVWKSSPCLTPQLKALYLSS